MEVTRIPYTKDFDSRVVDAARVSFKKKAENYTEEQNSKLIKYLIKHKHLSPFFHSHLTFLVDCSCDDLEEVLLNKRLMAGINISTVGKSKIISGSVWALLELSRYLLGVSCLLKDYAPTTVAWYEETYPEDDFEWAQTYIDIGPEIIAKGNESLKHTYKTLHIKLPIFIERQLIKHQLDFGFSFPLELAKNEVSRRYVSDTPEFYTPDNWRKASKDKKQGSWEDEFADWEPMFEEHYEDFLTDLYEDALKHKVCPEQARMVLPQSMYTEYYLTGNMSAWNRLLTLREDPHAQKEIRDLAQMIREALDG